mgnify:FL=1
MRILTLLILILTFQLNSAYAERVKPTFKQSFSLNGIVNSPADVDLSPDGTKIFFTAFHEDVLYQFNLTTAFDISTLDTSSEVQLDLNAGSDDIGTFSQGHAFNSDGTKIFAVSSNGPLNAHTLTTPYDLSNFSQVADDGINFLNGLGAGDGAIKPWDIEFNNDGTKMYLLDGTPGSVIEYDLSTAFDTSSATYVNELDVTPQTERVEEDLEFDDDGTRMYIIESGTTAAATKIYVYKLSTPFRTSTATYVGNIANFFDASGSNGTPLGLGFSNDGMKLYQTTYSKDGAGVLDMVYEYDLSCPYGIVICETEVTSNVGAQVDFAKNVINQSSSVIFKRFEWLRRNKQKDNLNSHNIKLNFKDPILASLSNTLLASLDNNNLPKTKSKKWSYWSHGDIKIGEAGDKININPKKVKSAGLMFGADRRIHDDKFIGASIRFAKEDVKILGSGGTNLNMQALTLNLYGTNGNNFNSLIGYSLLTIDQMLSDTTVGERYGKQAFTSVNFKSKNSYGNFNIKPSATFEYGVTKLFEYTDFGTYASNSVDTYEEHTFKTGGAAAGFTFDGSNVFEDKTIKSNGSLEYVADFTPTTTYKYKNHTNNSYTWEDVKRHSLHNVKGNIGFEKVFNTGTTFSINYERFQSLNESGHYDTLFFKFGHISEEDAELALNFNPLQNYDTNFSYKRNINGFDITFGSNYTLMSEVPDYDVNLKISNKY